MGLGLETDGGRTLFDGLEGILDLMDSALECSLGELLTLSNNSFQKIENILEVTTSRHPSRIYWESAGGMC